MRRWALLTVVLYAVTLAALTAPLLLTVIHDPKRPRGFSEDLRRVPELYGEWGYWLVLGILAAAEAVFLLVPIRVARGRPVPRRSWTALAVAAGFMMALLATALAFSLFALVRGDKMDEIHGWAGTLLGLWSWAAWAIVFAKYARTQDPASAWRKVVDRLLAGSVAELLVAVPVHVHVRQRDDCCAHGFTFIGLATGLAVLLFAFGPGVFFLFVRRARDRRPAFPAPRALSSSLCRRGSRRG